MVEQARLEKCWMERRTALLGGVLLLTSAAGAAIKLRERAEAPLRGSISKGIPTRIGDWAAMETDGLVRPEYDPAKKSIYDQEVSRVYYAAETAPVMLLIAYGSTQSDTLQVHRPEFCYPASGFDIGPSHKVPIELSNGGFIPSAFFTAVRAERTEHILYWTRLGDQFPTSWISQHLARVRNSARGIIPNGVLVRASIIGLEREQARNQLRSFVGQLVQRSSPLAQRALIGPLA